MGEAGGDDGAQADDVGVATGISQYADRARGEENGRSLTHLIVELRIAQFLDIDVTCPTQDVGLFRPHLVEGTRHQTRPREGVPVDRVGQQAELERTFVGGCQAGIAQLCRVLHQLLEMGGALERGEVADGEKFGVGGIFFATGGSLLQNGSASPTQTARSPDAAKRNPGR